MGLLSFEELSFESSLELSLDLLQFAVSPIINSPAIIHNLYFMNQI